MTRHRVDTPARNRVRPRRVAGVDAAALVFALLCLVSSATTWVAITVRPPAEALWRFAVPFTYGTGAAALALIALGWWLATHR